ncbi:MAG TPA: DUF2950 family protein, partial [Stenotrophomonas sp.]
MKALSALLLPLALLIAPLAAGAAPAFPNPEAAADALVAALGTTRVDDAKLAALFGTDWKSYVPADIDRQDVETFLSEYRKQHRIEKRDDGQAVISVGEAGWTFPVPLQQRDGGWRFDTQAGIAEMRVRLIGRNELATIQSVRTYHDAQTEYATEDHDGDGTLEYARKLISTDGQHDG